MTDRQTDQPTDESKSSTTMGHCLFSYQPSFIIYFILIHILTCLIFANSSQRVHHGLNTNFIAWSWSWLWKKGKGGVDGDRVVMGEKGWGYREVRRNPNDNATDHCSIDAQNLRFGADLFSVIIIVNFKCVIIGQWLQMIRKTSIAVSIKM